MKENGWSLLFTFYNKPMSPLPRPHNRQQARTSRDCSGPFSNPGIPMSYFTGLTLSYSLLLLYILNTRPVRAHTRARVNTHRHLRAHKRARAHTPNAHTNREFEPTSFHLKVRHRSTNRNMRLAAISRHTFNSLTCAIKSYFLTTSTCIARRVILASCKADKTINDV